MPYRICDYDVDDDVCPLLLFVHYFSHCFLQSFIKCPIFGHWSVLTENQIDKGHIHTHTHMFTSSMRLVYVCAAFWTRYAGIFIWTPPHLFLSLTHTWIVHFLFSNESKTFHFSKWLNKFGCFMWFPWRNTGVQGSKHKKLINSNIRLILPCKFNKLFNFVIL